MYNKIQNSTNFNGAWQIGKVTPEIERNLLNKFKRHRQYFPNFKKEGNSLVVLKNTLDAEMVNFVEQNKLTFRYYRDLDTFSKFDAFYPDEAEKILKTSRFPIMQRLEQVKHYLGKTSVRTALKPNKLYSDREVLAKFLPNALDLNAESKNGYKLFTDSAGKKIAAITMMNGEGKRYVYINSPISTSSNEQARYYLISRRNEIIQKFETPEEVKTFMKMFRRVAIKMSKTSKGDTN